MYRFIFYFFINQPSEDWEDYFKRLSPDGYRHFVKSIDCSLAVPFEYGHLSKAERALRITDKLYSGAYTSPNNEEIKYRLWRVYR